MTCYFGLTWDIIAIILLNALKFGTATWDLTQVIQDDKIRISYVHTCIDCLVTWPFQLFNCHMRKALSTLKSWEYGLAY
jgi:hypothetical protein